MAIQQQINKFIQGIGASPGIIIGKAYLIERSKVRLPQKRIHPRSSGGRGKTIPQGDTGVPETN